MDNEFLSLQSCMDQTLLCDGGNTYKLQHMPNAKLRKEGKLPISILYEYMNHVKGCASSGACNNQTMLVTRNLDDKESQYDYTSLLNACSESS